MSAESPPDPVDFAPPAGAESLIAPNAVYSRRHAGKEPGVNRVPPGDTTE